MKQIFVLLTAMSVMGSVMAEDTGPYHFEFEELASGVWTGIRPDSSRSPVMGNATFVISDVGVVVFDGGGMPAMSDQVIDKIRSLTDLPVTHVVISHWHGDHNFGIFRFTEEFPGVDIVAHEFTRDVMNSTRISYIDRQRNLKEEILPRFEAIVNARAMPDGTTLNDYEVATYQRLIDDADILQAEARRARVTPPNIVFTDNYTIQSGERTVELKFLGHANTAGDIVMWLPDERIVATGDIVVLPSPYAFNMPPRPWAQTLRQLKEMNYTLLVPGHGSVQTDTVYLDLLIRSAESIAEQRDALIADGVATEDIAALFDFSELEPQFTGGDDYLKVSYDEWFEQPFRAAAVKALGDGPMVDIEPAQAVPFDDERWQITAAEHEVVEYLGQQSLRIKGGSALLPELDIANGMVEFDMAVSEIRGFAGLLFRMQDKANAENFYIRPHQSGNPDANQYQPIFNGVSAWQLYHGAAYAAPVEYTFDEWMTVKVIFAGAKAEVYIDSEEPVLRIDELRRADRRGALGLNAANFSAVHFANFRYTQLSAVYELPWPVSVEPVAAGTVMAWEVSEAFDGDSLVGVTRLEVAKFTDRSWTRIGAEATGITNLAQAAQLGEGSDTVFVCTSVMAERPGTKQLHFGYSDSAMVFVNGLRVYSGDNSYLSRDYRYLGTIGLFDTVAMDLKAGKNEVCIAVTEAFGGWGVMARVAV
jgi:glyoxylase-like metal-dependent hydrolase (beta-lactamase superfamily II)